MTRTGQFTLCAIALMALLVPCVEASSEAPFPLFYEGSEALVLHRLELDPSTERVADLSDARVAVFQNQLPAPGPQLDKLRSRVESGMGLLIVLGPQIDRAALKAITDGTIGQTGALNAPLGPSHAAATERIAATIAYVGPKSDPLANEVSWHSAVRIYERSLLSTAPAVTVLVDTTSSDPVRPATPILMRTRVGRGTVYVLNVWLNQGNLDAREHSFWRMLMGAQGTRNYDFQRFVFFNYLLYYVTRDLAGVTPVRYSHWVAAPVPGTRTLAVLSFLIALMGAGLTIGFIAARRYSRRHPDAGANLYRHVPEKPMSLGAAAIPESAKPRTPPRGDPRWEIIGFHRPLSGFLFNYLLNIVLIIPFNFGTTFWLDRTFVNPFLEARGAGAAVGQVLLFLAPLLDLGTSQSTVKYFAEYRVKDPARAMGYVQFFVWFHLALGLIAFAALTLGGAALLPSTQVGYLSWFVVLFTMTAFPPFYLTFVAIFRSYQRFDYVQLTTVLFYVMYPMVQMTSAIYGRHWGLVHPEFGEGMGAVMGFAAGGILAHFLLGLICGAFYHRSGMRLLTVVLASFDVKTVKESLVYGVKATVGTVMPFLSWAAVPVILARLLPNFLELNEIWVLTYGLTFAYLETGASIFATMMPSISEAFSHGMRALTQRYADQGLRWGLMITSLLGGVYVAFSPVLIGGLLPPQFGRALAVIGLMHFFRLFDFATRMPDQFFMGAGRIGTFSWVVAVEHVGRIVFTWLMIKHFGFAGLFYGFMASAALKSLIAWPLMSRLVVPPVFSVWQTLLSPSIAALCNYLAVRAIVVWMWRGAGHLGNTWMVIMLCMLASYPIYMFISGLLGWDQTEMNEFKDAVDLVPSPFRPLATLGYQVVRVGTQLSPLQGRFPAKLASGIDEAAILTDMKAELH